jgi:hypothetical protein
VGAFARLALVGALGSTARRHAHVGAGLPRLLAGEALAAGVGSALNQGAKKNQWHTNLEWRPPVLTNHSEHPSDELFNVP